MTEKVTPEVRRAILAQKITLWQNTAFDAELDVKVAQALDDAQAEQQARERLKQALKAVQTLEQLEA